jgi:glycosyltransferase involved in cell wall biosynthesis
MAKIIHGHHIKAMSIYLLFNFLLRKKTVYTVHGSYLYLSEQNKKLLRYIFNKVDSVVFVNRFLYDILPNDLKNIIQNKYKIILNGVDTNFQYRKVDIYQKYKLNKEDILIFHPARFVLEKNHLNIIEAFKLISVNNSNLKLILAGDGVLRGEIEKRIEDLDLKEQVVLLGLIEKNDVYNFLEKSELFIMPSISEGLNIAFLEAMSMKTKILVSDIEQFTYPFEHYHLNPKDYNTYFTNPNNIDAIAKSLHIALNSKKNEDFDMNVFSLDTMIKEYKQIYQRLIK